MKSSEGAYFQKLIEYYSGERKRQPAPPRHLLPSYRHYVIENIKRAARARVAAK